MARAKPELRPCGIAAGPVAASGHLNSWEFALEPSDLTIEISCVSSTHSPMTALAASRGKTCFDSAYPVTYTYDTFKRNFLAAPHGRRRHG